MKPALDPNDRQFLHRLHRMQGGTVQEICDDVGVTATAVRHRLSRLQGLGLVTRRTVRSGRGRPHHRYEPTEKGLRELGDNYSDLAMILWREVKNIQPPEVRNRVLQRVQEALVDRFGDEVSGRSLQERMTKLKSALEQRGFDVEVDESGELPILRENNCPYLDLAHSDPEICELEQAVFEKALGTPVTLTHCCLDGYPCCEFQPAEEPA